MAAISDLATLAMTDVAASDYLPIFDASASTDKKVALYVAGTWTPTLTVGSGSVSTSVNGRYARIGKMVLVSAIITVSGVSSPTGDLYIPVATLPAAPETNFHFAVAVTVDNLLSVTGAAQAFMYNNIYIRRVSAGVEYADMASRLQSSSQIIFTACYIAN